MSIYVTAETFADLEELGFAFSYSDGRLAFGGYGIVEIEPNIPELRMRQFQIKYILTRLGSSALDEIAALVAQCELIGHRYTLKTNRVLHCQFCGRQYEK